jgi:hypothetical protein
VGVDAAFRTAMGPGAVKGEAEADWGQYSNSYGKVALTALRAQGGYQWGMFEGNVRYGVILPSDQLAYKGVQLTGNKGIQEITPSLTMRIKAPGSPRITADLPILVNVPVVTENNLGNYVVAEQPDQVSLIGTPGNAIARQTVVEARLMFEAQF